MTRPPPDPHFLTTPVPTTRRSDHATHRAKPAARVLLPCHPPYATALATLKDPAMKPIVQNTARFFDLVSYYLGFGGIADDTEEGTRLAAALGDKPVMLM